MRNLLVHLDSSPQSASRLSLAVNLAARRRARLVGVFAQCSKSHKAGVVASWPPGDYQEAAAASAGLFAAATAPLGQSTFVVPAPAHHEWYDLNRGAEGEITQQMVDLCRHFDLVICGQPLPDNALVPPDLIERIVVDSGRPVLTVPYAGQFEDVGHRPLYAWSDSREAARALADSIDLATPDAQGLVVSITKANDDKVTYLKTSLALAVAHLAANGIAARADQTISGDVGLMDSLLNLAADNSADLLVLGGFGGQGYPRFSRGSGSRFMLKHMTLPVLFSY